MSNNNPNANTVVGNAISRFMARLLVAGVFFAFLQAVTFSYYKPASNKNATGGEQRAVSLSLSNATNHSVSSNTTAVKLESNKSREPPIISPTDTATIAVQHARRRHDDHYYPPGFPILVTGLPKSGTTSIHKLFICSKSAGFNSSHTYSKVNKTAGVRVGKCYEKNVLQSKPPLYNCGNYNVWTDNGYADFDNKCFYPSIHGLSAFYKAYPNGTIFMNLRNTTKWVNGIKKWSGGSLLERFRNCNNAHGMLPKNAFSNKDIGDWYDQHNAAVQKFALAHPSLRYVELDIESPTFAQDMQTAFGVKRECWRHCKPGRAGCKDVV